MRRPFSRRRRAIPPDELDALVERNVALARRLDAEERDLLVDVAAGLIATKRWEAAAGATLTDEVLATVAANAAIPILFLDPWLYRHVRAVIVQATTTVTRAVRAGPGRGTFSDHPMPVVGQALADAGPVSVSWDSALADSRNPGAGRNVVIHEFAHKIDMSDGYSDGTPPLRGDALDRWSDVLADEYERSTARPSDSVLRAYAWSNPAEFFAVSTEVFFCLPDDLAEAKPELYAALSGFYRQDPAGR